MEPSLTYPAPSELLEEFEDLETAEERIQFLIELGQSLPDFPSEYCTEEFRVVGCQSMVWIVPQWDGELFHFRASSDAPMVRGLAGVLLSAYSGKSPRDILEFSVDEFFEKLHLKTFLSPLRSNGLNSMVKRIRHYADTELVSDGTVSPSVKTPAPEAAQDLGSIQDRIQSIRDEFPILSVKNGEGEQIAYLDNAASSQRPRAVIESISELFSEHYSNVHRSGHAWASETTIKMEESREAVRRFIHAPSADEVIFTAGTTASINLVACAWGNSNLQPGDEIVITEMEHHSNIVPWQQLSQRTGCRIVWVPILPDYTLDMKSYADSLSERTKLVAITAVSNVLGTINPVKSMTAMAHQVGAKVLVDAAQAIPHGSLDVQDWDADFVVFSGHKMLASSGVGVLYGKRSLLESMPAWQGGGSMIKAVTFDGFTVADLPHKFEAGTPPIAEIISLSPAIEFLESIGKQRLMEHERMLVGTAMVGLSKLDGVRTYSPALEQKCGILSFSVDGIHGEEIARVLDGRGIAIRVGHHCAMPLHARLAVPVTCRASFYLYNTLDEVSRLVESVSHAIKLLRR
jgi:cysteine desulfurase/selenocysteine lyase